MSQVTVEEAHSRTRADRTGAPDAENPVRLHDRDYVDELTRKRLMPIAWAGYRIREEAARDVVQSTFVAFLEVRHRYPVPSEHERILIGVFRKKCLEHIDRSARERRRLERYRARQDAARGSPRDDPGPRTGPRSVLDDLVHREEGSEIRAAIAALRPSSREIVSCIVDDELTRKSMIAHFRLNRNTLDSRLHVTRRELRALLARFSIAV